MIRFSRRKDPSIVPTSGWVAWLTGTTATVMAFLAVLALSAGMASDRLAAAWRADLSGVATVRLLAPDDKREARLRQVVEVLRTTPGISEVRVLSSTEQTDLLKPWLGADLDLDDLPTPQLIDVTLSGTGPDANALQDRLDRTVEGAVYDDHAAWRAPLAQAAIALKRLAWIATALTVVAAGTMVVVAARLTLVANRDVVSVVRLIGGEDRYIARAFVTRLSIRAWIGGLAGALGGGACLRLLPQIDSDSALDVTLMPDTAGWLVLLIGVPLATGLIAWATARITVSLTLRRIA